MDKLYTSRLRGRIVTVGAFWNFRNGVRGDTKVGFPEMEEENQPERSPDRQSTGRVRRYPAIHRRSLFTERARQAHGCCKLPRELWWTVKSLVLTGVPLIRNR